MLYGFLVTGFVFACVLLVIIILVQQSKGGMGLGSMGGSTQMLFGGSGGQDLFQKITWGLVAVFMLGSLILSLMRSQAHHGMSRYVTRPRTTQQMPVPQSTMPAPVAPQPQPEAPTVE